MKQLQVGRQALLAVVLGYVEYSLRFIVGAVTIALIIRAFGSEVYGIYVFMTSGASYLAISDLGFSMANVREVGQAFVRKDNQALQVALTSSLAIFITIALVIFVLSWFVSPLLAFLGHIPQKSYSGAVLLGRLAGTSVALMMLSSWVNGVLRGSTHLIRFQSARVVERVLYFGGVLWAVTIGGEIKSLGWALIASSGIAFLLRLALLHRVVPIGSLLHPSFVSRKQVRSLASFSSAVIIPMINELVLNQADSLLIGVILGPQAVSIYAIAARLYQYIDKLTDAMSTTVFPLFLRYSALSNLTQAKKWYGLVIMTTMSVGIIGAVGYALLGQKAIQLWTGGRILAPVSLIVIFSVLLLARSGLQTGCSVLLAFSRHWALARQQIFEMALNLTLTVILLRLMGVTGAALGTLLAEATTVLWFVPVTVVKTLCIPRRQAIQMYILSPLLVTLPAFLAICSLTWVLKTDPLTGLIATTATGAILGIIGIVWIGYTVEQRKALKGQLQFLVQGILRLKAIK